MRPFDRQELARLLGERSEPCISLCMPTHRKFPEAQQDPIKFGNLTREIASALERKYDRRDEGVSGLVEKLTAMGAEGPDGQGAANFWSHQKDGLAVFLSPTHFSYYRVPIALRDITVVSRSFHVKPLLPLLHENRRYHVLTVTQKDVRLHEGTNTEELSEVTLADGVPRSLTDALGTELDDSRSGLSYHGGRGAGGAVHGAGRATDDEKDELRRFFRTVDRAVDEHHSKPAGCPLILAAVEHYHSLFRSVSKNPRLLESGITQDPKSLSLDELRTAALAVFQPIREQRLAEVIEEYGAAQARHLGSGDLQEVASAAVAGRVKRLVLEEKRRIWGRLDRETGAVSDGGSEGNPDDSDLLDELAELTLSQGGEILMAPREHMPTTTGLAATYRF